MQQRASIAIVLAVLLAACTSGGVSRPAQPEAPTKANVGGPAQAPTTPAALPFLSNTVPVAELQRRLNQFAPAPLDFDENALQPWEKQVLKKLVEASFVIHEIFALQVSEKIPEWRTRLETEEGAGKSAAIDFFDIMVGPWDRVEHDQAFLDVGKKPEGAGFYPSDMTKQEFETYIAQNPQEKTAFTGYFTVIRRDANKKLIAVPYSKFYHDELTRASRLLHEAAALSQNASLKDFLNKRADAFLSDDYYASDVAWMDLSGTAVEPTIGPYEVYEDGLFGYKAAFESFITVADPKASADLDGLKSRMRDLERSLPVDDKYKNPNRGFESPIRVVDVVYNSGDGRRGIQTIAFNLPNDEKVIEAKGSKKVMLRNMMRAKFDKILVPIATQALASSQVADVQFQPWFINVLAHELAHGLGPKSIKLASGETTTVNRQLKELYSTIEEAKADVTGLHNLSVLQQQGVYDADFVRRAYIGHVADIFRCVRFGTSEAHGQGCLLQFNYLVSKNALRFDPKETRFSVDLPTLVTANRELATEILTLQGEGSYQKADALLKQYGTESPELKAVLAKLSTVPVDIKPEHTVLQKMAAW